MMLKAAVEGAPAESQRLRSLADVAAVPLERLADEHAFDLLQRQVLESRGGAAAPETQVGSVDSGTMRHQHGPLERMVELAHVARPGVALERLESIGLESGERLPVAGRVAAEEVLSERPDVVATLAERRQVNLDRVEPEQQ